MKSYRKELWFHVPTRRAFINITSEIEAGLRESEIREGLCLVNATHITASVFVNDDEAGLHRDYERWLEALAPHEPTSQYDHNLTGEDNGDAHLKRQVMGRSVTLAVTNGRIDLGPWEQACANSMVVARNEFCSRSSAANDAPCNAAISEQAGAALAHP